MDRFKILERCRENAEKWEANAVSPSYTANFRTASRIAAKDWRTLEAEIEASIKEETDNIQQGEHNENK